MLIAIISHTQSHRHSHCHTHRFDRSKCDYHFHSRNIFIVVAMAKPTAKVIAIARAITIANNGHSQSEAEETGIRIASAIVTALFILATRSEFKFELTLNIMRECQNTPWSFGSRPLATLHLLLGAVSHRCGHMIAHAAFWAKQSMAASLPLSSSDGPEKALSLPRAYCSRACRSRRQSAGTIHLCKRRKVIETALSGLQPGNKLR